MEWFALRPIIETAVPESNPTEDGGDILYIFDSCSAGAAGAYDGPELLAASGWNNKAGLSLAKSFTQTLISKLRELDGAPTTVAQIFSAMFREAYENSIESMPVHISQLNRPSIILAQLPLQQRPKPESARRRAEEFAAAPTSTHRVLISVNLKDNVALPDVQEWANYLTTNIPSGVLSADISVHNGFEGSVVLIMTLPLEVWSMLPDNAGYNFIAHVGRELALAPGLGPIRPALPLRMAQPSGTENVPPSHSPREKKGGSRPPLSSFR